MVPRDDPCPKRGDGLGHSTVTGKCVCVHCDQVTYTASDPIAALRQQVIRDDPERQGDFSCLTARQWHVAILVRHRYEHGDLSEWPVHKRHRLRNTAP